MTGKNNQPAKRVRFGRLVRLTSIFVLSAFFSLAAVACMQSTQTEAAAQAAGGDPPNASEQQTQAIDRGEGRPDAGWHLFGGSHAVASPQPRPTSGVWRHFGSADSHYSTNATPSSGSPNSGSSKNESGAYGSTGRSVPGNSSPGYGSGSSSSGVNAPGASSRRVPARAQYGQTGTSDLAQQMFELLNRDRLNAGVRPLRWNARAAAVAREHSLDMLRRGYFDHVGPDGKSVGDRLIAAGIDWQAAGENIAIAHTISQGESEFMNEPRYQQNHRWNILNSGYTEVGVGIVQGSDGQLYITQDFMKAP